MPEWVIVGEDEDGTPMVLVDWIVVDYWESIATVKDGRARPTLFRDRWRAKRQSRRLPRKYAPRAIHYDRL